MQLIVEVLADLFQLFAKVIRLGLQFLLRLLQDLVVLLIGPSLDFHELLVLFHQLQVLIVFLPELLLELLAFLLLPLERALQDFIVGFGLHFLYSPLVDQVLAIHVPFVLRLLEHLVSLGQELPHLINLTPLAVPFSAIGLHDSLQLFL